MKYTTLQYKYYSRKKIEKDKEVPSYIGLGFFDGVHLGHQSLLSSCAEEAKKAHAVSTVVLLEPHLEIIIYNKNNLHLLTTLPEKIKRIRNIGIEQVIVLKFNKELKEITAEDFIIEILLNKFNMGAVFVGHNYNFGYQKKGDTILLKELSRKYSFKNYVVKPVSANKDIAISSSAIRTLLKKGDIIEANRLLGYSYQISGEIIHGHKRGKEVLSFPTINLNISSDKLLPRNGVYIALINVERCYYQGLVNIGFKPTFQVVSDSELLRPSVEAHIFNFDQDIYQKKANISLLKRIRDEKKFQTGKELAGQIREDQLAAEIFFQGQE